MKSDGVLQSGLAQKPSASASARFSRQIAGDLDNIVLKALRKEPQRRYVSVEQFAEDIRRHLQGLPVSAAPDVFSYRASKFVRRHKFGVVAVVVIVLAVAAGIITTVREARIAEANRRRAEARFNDVRKLANSLIFEVHQSIMDLPGATPARKLILQRALEYLDSLAKESGNEPDLTRELATAYARIGELQGDPLDPNLGDPKAAMASLQKSLQLRESLARGNPQNGKDQVELAVAYLDYSEFQTGVAGNLTGGLDYNRKAIDILDREFTAEPNNLRVVAQNTRAYSDLGFIRIGNGAQGSVGTISSGVAALEKALSLDQHLIEIAPDNVQGMGQKAVVNLSLGDAMLKLGERPRAAEYYHQALDILNTQNAKSNNIRTVLNAIVVEGKLGDVLMIEGKTAEATSWYRRQQQDAMRSLAGDPENDSVQRLAITTSGLLGHALLEGGQIDNGLQYIRAAQVRASSEASQTPLIRIYQAIIHIWVGEADERRNRIDAAAQEYRKSQEILEAVRAAGANDLRIQGYYCWATDSLAAALLKLGKLDEARDEYEKSRAVLEPLGQSNPDNLEILYALAETYTGEGRVFKQRARTAGKHDSSGNWAAAGDWFQRSLYTWSKVSHPSHFSTSWMEVTLPSKVSQQLSECRARQAGNNLGFMRQPSQP